MRLADKRSTFGIKVAHLDLRRAGRFGRPDQFLSVRRRHRLVQVFEFHHILKRERMLSVLRKRGSDEKENR